MSKLNNLRGFASWIVFALFPNSMVAEAALVGFGVALALFIIDRRRGTPFDAMVLDAATLFFFAALSVAGFAAPHASLGTWSSALSFGWLAIIAWSGIALGRPFTLAMARRRVSSDISELPAFQRSQVALSRLWAIVFTLVAALLIVCDLTHQGALLTLTIRLAGLTVGGHLTSRHIKAARLRIA